jgi:leucyl/phenylalanyl-tRNA--protein transferase
MPWRCMTFDRQSLPLSVQGSNLSERRAALFRESIAERATRWALGTAWALKPNRIGGLPALAGLWLSDAVAGRTELPDPGRALTQPDGLCGFVHDLSVPTLVEAYRRGLYPFAHIAPLKWWSPAERCVLLFDEFHLAKRLRHRLRQARYTVTLDRDFEAVMKACAAPRAGKWPLTWITPQIMHAYAALHDAGYAHSFEVWNPAGELVGGGYGVAVGRTFTIESQFTRESHTSKVGFAVLNWHLAKWGYVFSDNKGATRNVLEMGFKTIPRRLFQTLLGEAARMPEQRGRWTVETDLPTVAAWMPERDGHSRSIPGDLPSGQPATASSGRLGHAGAAFVPMMDVLDGEVMGYSLAALALMG